jgi:hypothetical protein
MCTQQVTQRIEQTDVVTVRGKRARRGRFDVQALPLDQRSHQAGQIQPARDGDDVCAASHCPYDAIQDLPGGTSPTAVEDLADERLFYARRNADTNAADLTPEDRNGAVRPATVAVPVTLASEILLNDPLGPEGLVPGIDAVSRTATVTPRPAKRLSSAPTAWSPQGLPFTVTPGVSVLDSNGATSTIYSPAATGSTILSLHVVGIAVGERRALHTDLGVGCVQPGATHTAENVIEPGRVAPKYYVLLGVHFLSPRR